jgi:tRNA pseudouridine55 synthase
MNRWSMGRKLRNSSVNSMPDKHHSPVEGLLNVDKPPELTSHDVVARIRRLTRVSRVGHAGTLDPQATGVLLVGLGRGTKLTQFLHECPKTYRASLRLGIRTDSYDAAGKVVEVRPLNDLGQDQVEAVLGRFRGEIGQVPPMFSALKHQGRRLYTLARQGVDVERQPRRVQIFRLDLLDLTAGTLRVEVECSSGTYIRVLADDIGTQLGCGAHLSELVRTAIGPFTLEGALTLPALEEAVRQGNWHHHVHALSAAVKGLPSLVITGAAAKALAHGTAPTRQGVCERIGTFAAGETVAVLDQNGTLLAMASPLCSAAALDTVPAGAPVLSLRRVLMAEGGSANAPDGRP